MRMADRHLIDKCLDGDSAAFGMLVERYKEGVYALAYSMLHNFHDAEDITQEAFIKAYQNLRKLRGWDEFHSWLYAITSNLCKDWLKIQSRQPDSEFIEDHAESLDQYSSDPSRDSMVDQLHEALESLPETYQQVLTLHYLGGMDGSEMAEFLGVSPTSIYQRLSRARSLLRKEMLDMMSETFEQNRFEDFYEELAHHYKLGGNDETAIDYLLKAGIKIADQSNQSALQYFNQAEELLNHSTLPHKVEKVLLYEYRGCLLLNSGHEIKRKEALKDYEELLKWCDDPHDRAISALFIGVEFTQLSAIKSSEVVSKMVTDCFNQICSIVYNKYEGAIYAYIGDVILALFGVPLPGLRRILPEDNAKLAILAAIDMKEAVKDYPIQVFIGINTAYISTGIPYIAYETSINLAERLQESAEPGQVLVGSGTHHLTRSAFDFDIISDLTVKGLSKSVTAYSVKQAKVHP